MTGVERLWTQTIQVHILLCGTSEKCIPLFCIISRLAKQDLEVCIEGPGEQESRPLREDCQVSKKLAAGRGRPEAMGTQQRRRRKAKEPKAPRNKKQQIGLPASRKGASLCPGLPLGAKIILWLASHKPSPLHPTPHSTYFPTLIFLSL